MLIRINSHYQEKQDRHPPCPHAHSCPSLHPTFLLLKSFLKFRLNAKIIKWPGQPKQNGSTTACQATTRGRSCMSVATGFLSQPYLGTSSQVGSAVPRVPVWPRSGWALCGPCQQLFRVSGEGMATSRIQMRLRAGQTELLQQSLAPGSLCNSEPVGSQTSFIEQARSEQPPTFVLFLFLLRAHSGLLAC